jgi:hypothetical protein
MKTMKVETPISKDDASQVKFEEIPLPPQEMWAELDNSGAAQEATKRPDAVSAPDFSKPMERLAFVGDATERSIPLKFPFDWNGERISTIVMRRLTVLEVGNLLERLPQNFDNYDIYAGMAGLPASVLRGLIDDDGEEVTQVGYDFLPQLFRKQAPASEPLADVSAST